MEPGSLEEGAVGLEIGLFTMEGTSSDTPTRNAAAEANGTSNVNHNSISKEGGTMIDPKAVSSRDLIECSIEQLIGDINAKRKRDTALLEDFKKALEMHCSAAYASTEAAVYNMYEKNQAAIQDRLQELFAVLDRIGNQVQELDDFKASLATLYSDL